MALKDKLMTLEDFKAVRDVDVASNSAQFTEIKADLADVPNRAVKSAEQLISDKRTTDKVPYKYRASQSGKSDRAYDMIVGGTVCFNQLVANGDFSDTSGWAGQQGSIAISNNKCTWTATSDNATGGIKLSSLNGIQGHKYFCSMSVTPSVSTKCSFYLSGGHSNARTIDAPANNKTRGMAILEAESLTSGMYVYCNCTQALQANDTCIFESIFIVDLTAMFGTAIADQIYSIEQATAGAGVALFMAMFPNDYYPYNAGSLVSIEGLSAHVMRDGDDNIIGSYPLDSSLTLRGVPVLKDGKIEFDGDTYEASGTVTRRFIKVILTQCANVVLHSSGFYYTTFSLPSLSTGRNADLVIDNGYTKEAGAIVPGNVYLISSGLTLVIVFLDQTMTTKAQINDYLANNPVTVVYKLATPTTEEAVPYTNPQVVNGYGTEEYISESICPVGHITKYPDNLRAKIDGLPWDLSMIAPVEVAYTATRNYTTGQLLIVDNTLYKVTANVANGGTITVGTNVVATTLSEVIESLS